ncbi:hypothetical protein GNF82_13985 [Clostridium perfringens]
MITAKGSEVKEYISKVDLTVKDEYITLKEGQSVKVRVLAVDDYVEYTSHGAYGLDIYTQPCQAPEEHNCVYCKAAAGVEEFKILKGKPRYLFAFANIENCRVMLLDVSKGEAKKLMTNIDKYAKNIENTAFTLDRVGSGKETAYALNPILGMEPAEQAQFDKFNGVTVDIQYFIDRLQIRVPSEDFKLKILAKAGFLLKDFEDLFGADLVEKALADDTENATRIEEKPEDVI